MHKQVQPKIFNFSDIVARHGGAQKGNGLTIETDTGIMSFTRRRSTGFGVKNTPITFGMLISGPMADDSNVRLGKGECLLKLTTGPLQDTTFYKFKKF